jgi:hypothetical protein
MKSVRVLVIASVSLLIGYGLFVTLNARGQQPLSPDTGANLLNQDGLFALNVGHRGDAEMDKLFQEEAEADRKVTSLMESYAHTEGEAKRSEIKSNLSTALEKEFDVQQRRRDLELKRVEERLKKVRDLMDKRKDARRSIIEKRLDQLIREADGLGWTPPAGINLHQRGFGNWIQPQQR